LAWKPIINFLPAPFRMPEPIPVDGAAGGQVLRTSLALSALTGKPFTISSIRSNRPNPGLQPQHFTAVKTLAETCHAEIEGAVKESRQLTFKPGKVRPSSLQVNIGSAGSVTLLLQALLPPSLREEVRLRVMGGTDVPFAPPANYFSGVLQPALKAFGVHFEFSLNKRGYYPKGNGAVSFKSVPGRLPLKAVDFTELGQLQSIQCVSHCASLPREVAVNQARAAHKKLEEFDCEWIESIEAAPHSDTIGSGLDLLACFDNGAHLGANALGAKGKPAVTVGEEAAVHLLKSLRSLRPVDVHLADQLIPFMGLAKGTSFFQCAEVSQHLLSSIAVTKQFLDCEISIVGDLGQPGRVTVKGVGFA